MIALHSFIPTTELQIQQKQSELDLIKHQAKLSCKFLRRHGFTPVLYTTEALKNKLFSNCKYDQILSFTEEEEYLIKYYSEQNFWSSGKLFACKAINEPYVHFDIDLFLIENHLVQYVNLPFFTFHSETFMQKMYSSLHRDILEKFFQLDMSIDTVYNCAIFGAIDFNTVNNQILKTLKFIDLYNKLIDQLISTIEKPGQRNKWKKTVFIEQLFLIKNIRTAIGLPKVATIVESAKANNHSDIFKILERKNILHLWIHKGLIHETIGLEKFLAMLDKYYF